MIGDNGFFKVDDERIEAINGFTIPDGWWSRHYEYAFALPFAPALGIAADMGAGYEFRPIKNALATVCAKIYAVDAHPKLLQQDCPRNMEMVIADFTERVDEIHDESIDTVFCISVLEDVGSKVPLALKEFKRIVKPEGRIVLTFDVPYDDSKPTPHYPGVNLDNFIEIVKEAGLVFQGDLSFDKTDALYHEEFNLCVYHCVLTKP